MHICKPYLTLELVKQDKSLKYNGSSILLCPTLYCVQAIYCINKNTVSTLAFNIHLFNFPLSTSCGRFMLCSVQPFFPFWNDALVNFSWKQGHLCPMHIFFHFLWIENLRWTQLNKGHCYENYKFDEAETTEIIFG